MNALPQEVRLNIINRQIDTWEQQRYSYQIEHRVYTRIGGDEVLKNLVAEMGKCEKAIDALTELRDQVTNEGAVKG